MDFARNAKYFKKPRYGLPIVVGVSFLFLFTFSPLAAQESKEPSGAILGTFGIGFTQVSADYETWYQGEYISSLSLADLILDLELISSHGFSVSLGYSTFFKIGTGLLSMSYMGVGYDYLTDAWNIGASVFFAPYGEGSSGDVIIGVKGRGGYWFTRSLGISVILLWGGGAVFGDSLFSISPGISVRL